MTTGVLRDFVSLGLMAPVLVAAVAGCRGDGVTRPDVAQVMIATPSGEVGLGARVQYVAAAMDERGDTLSSARIQWHSSEPANVRVDSNGEALALEFGGAWIVATSQGTRDSSELRVRECPGGQKPDDPIGRREDIGNPEVWARISADSLAAIIRRMNGRSFIGFKEAGAEHGFDPSTGETLVSDETIQRTTERLVELGIVVCHEFRRTPTIATGIPPLILDGDLVTRLREDPNVEYLEPDPPIFPIDEARFPSKRIY